MILRITTRLVSILIWCLPFNACHGNWIQAYSLVLLTKIGAPHYVHVVGTIMCLPLLFCVEMLALMTHC